MKRLPVVARGGTVVAYALVDDEDFEALSAHRWFMNRAGYAWTNIDEAGPWCRWQSMHRRILGLQPGDGHQGDHRNRNRLDNRRSNLRVVTGAQNSQNTSRCGGSSQYRGVTWHKQAGKWQASAKLRGKSYHLGLFDTELEAAHAARGFRRESMPFSVEDAA